MESKGSLSCSQESSTGTHPNVFFFYYVGWDETSPPGAQADSGTTEPAQDDK
jgi:hypothetical protein